MVRPATLVRVCDECNYGSYEGRCVICGGTGVSDAYYCKECTMQEKDVRRGEGEREWGGEGMRRRREKGRGRVVEVPLFWAVEGVSRLPLQE